MSWIQVVYVIGFENRGCVYENGQTIEHSIDPREKVLQVVGRILKDGYNAEVIQRGNGNYTVTIK